MSIGIVSTIAISTGVYLASVAILYRIAIAGTMERNIEAMKNEPWMDTYDVQGGNLKRLPWIEKVLIFCPVVNTLLVIVIHIIVLLNPK